MENIKYEVGSDTPDSPKFELRSIPLPDLFRNFADMLDDPEKFRQVASLRFAQGPTGDRRLEQVIKEVRSLMIHCDVDPMTARPK